MCRRGHPEEDQRVRIRPNGTTYHTCLECRRVLQRRRRKSRSNPVPSLSKRRLPFKPMADFVAGLVASSGKTARDLLLEGEWNVYYRARDVGWVSELVADRFALSRGVHPWEIWPEWFAD